MDRWFHYHLSKCGVVKSSVVLQRSSRLRDEWWWWLQLDTLLLALNTECFDHFNWGNVKNSYPVECFWYLARQHCQHFILCLFITLSAFHSSSFYYIVNISFFVFLFLTQFCLTSIYTRRTGQITLSTLYVHANGYIYFNTFTVLPLILITTRHNYVINSLITITTTTTTKKICDAN